MMAWEDLVECPGCGMAVPKAGECGNPDCPHYTGKKRAVYSPPAIESSRSLGPSGVTPFRCCASPDEAEIVLEGFSHPVTASWGTYRGEGSLRLVGCRRCGVVMARVAALEEPVRLIEEGPADTGAFRAGLDAAVVAAKERPAEKVIADVAQIAFTQAGDPAAALEAIRELLQGTRFEKNRHTGALIFGQCTETDSGGARCELPEGHEGRHACPKAVEQHLQRVERVFAFGSAPAESGPDLYDTFMEGVRKANSPERGAVAEESKPEALRDTMYSEGVQVEGGKYRFFLRQGDYRIHVERGGESWLTMEAGGKAILAMMHELEAAREQLAELSVDAARGVEERTAWLNSEGRGGRED